MNCAALYTLLFSAMLKTVTHPAIIKGNFQ